MKLTRENGVPLMFTLAQLSYWSAKHLGDTRLQSMQERGRVQVGKIADLTLFDPEKVVPRAIYKLGENGLPPIGIPYFDRQRHHRGQGFEVFKDVNPGQGSQPGSFQSSGFDPC